MPEAKWLEKVWFGKLKEVIDKYQPDMIRFDSWLDRIPEEYRTKFCASYLNDAAKRGKEVVILRKQEDMPIDFTVLDHEKSRMSEAREHVWMTDDTISRGSWCYTEDLKIKPAADIIHALADTVSKNGIVLLNVSPMADGSIPDDQRETLKGIGEWMKVNGEAIYATQPWGTFGEGPTKEPKGGFRDHGKFLNLKYSYKDIRFTQSKDGKTVYAIMLGWPESEKEVTVELLGSGQGEVSGVRLLGCDGEIEWKQTDDGLVITLPAEMVGDAAVAFRVAVE